MTEFEREVREQISRINRRFSAVENDIKQIKFEMQNREFEIHFKHCRMMYEEILKILTATKPETRTRTVVDRLRDENDDRSISPAGLSGD